MIPRPLLFVDHAPAMGGAEHSLLLLLAQLDGDRWQRHLAGVDGPLLEAAAQLGVRTHPLSLRRLRRSPGAPLDLARGVAALRATAQQAGADAIYANTVRAAVYAAPAARLARRPFIWHVRDFWLGETAPRHRLADRAGKRLLAASAAAVIANSRATAAHLPPSDRLHVIPNGIDISRFDPKLSGATFRQEFGIPPDAPLVTMVGRLRPWKGQRRFLAMATTVHHSHPGAHFAIVGGAPFGVDKVYTESLREDVVARGLADVVRFTGQLSDVRPALAAANVFVHPGEPEPFGLVNIEAMAMGKPVVAFAHGALPEIVRDGLTGRLVPPGDVAALATAVAALLASAEMRGAWGAAGRERAAQHFAIERVAAGVDALLKQVVGG